MNSIKAAREYDVSLDSRNRLTLRGAEYENYRVIEYEDGSYRLEPRVLVAPHVVSRRTLMMMDEAMDNFDRGKVSDPIDPGELTRPGQ